MSATPEQLVQGFIDGSLSRQEFTALEQWINTSDEHRAAFLRYLALHRYLREHYVAEGNNALIDALSESFAGEPGSTEETDSLLNLFSATDFPVDGERILSEIAGREIPGDQTLASDRSLPIRHGEVENRASVMPMHASRDDRPERVLSLPGFQVYRGVQRTRGSRFAMRLAVAAGLFLAVAIGWYVWTQQGEEATTPSLAGRAEQPEENIEESEPFIPGPVVIESGPRDPIVARIGYTIDASWDQAVPMSAGVELEAGGSFVLTEGYAEVVMNRGASVVLEAPCELMLIDDNRVEFRRGRMSAFVPGRARFFTVATPTAEIVDFGTEFEVEVEADGRTKAAVFAGDIELREAMSEANPFPRGIPITKGWHGEVKADGTLKPSVEALSLSRVGLYEEVTIRKAAAAGSAYDRWKLHSIELRRDPSLLAYYTFERDRQSATTLRNVAEATSGRLNGKLGVYGGPSSRPTWVEGRFPGKTALRFERDAQQGVRISHHPDLPFTDPLSIVLWIKRDAPDYPAGIFVSKRNDRGTTFQFGMWGQEWSEAVTRGRIQFVGRYYGDIRNVFNTEPLFINREQWEMFACTFDGKSAAIYHNGMFYEAGDLLEPLREINAHIILGVSGDFDDWNSGHHFDGVMDELAIFNRVLSAEEVAGLYEAGSVGTEKDGD